MEDIRNVPVSPTVGLIARIRSVAIDDEHVNFKIGMRRHIRVIRNGQRVGDRVAPFAAPEDINVCRRSGNTVALPLLAILIHGDLDASRTSLCESNGRWRNDYRASGFRTSRYQH